MKRFTSLKAWLPLAAFAVGVSLLGSCTKHPELPVPNVRATQVQASVDMPSLRQLFLTKGYDQQLTQQPNGWTWTPRWDQTSQTIMSESATYVYVPLVPSQTADGRAIRMQGASKYVVIQLSGTEVAFNIATYLLPSSQSSSPLTSFANFTGVMLLNNLATVKALRVVYQNGVGQWENPGSSVPNGRVRPEATNTVI